jgi:hypothetical protein
MNGAILIDLTVIPDALAGLAAVTKTMALPGLAFLIPFTVLQMNVQALKAKEYPSYSGLLARVLVTLLCLLAYKKLFYSVLKLSQVMSFAVLGEEQWGNFLAQSFKGSSGSSYPTLSILFKSLSSFQEIVLFLTSLLALTVRDVVVILQACFLSLLYAFGPLALVCAVNEKTAQVTRGWLANTFQVASWSFFLRLTVRVWLTLGPLTGSSGRGMADDYIGILAVNVTFLILVLGTPLVAAKLLSGENIATLGAAALGAVQTTIVAKQLQAGRFLSKEADRYAKAKPDERRSLYHHPIASTMTAARDRLFGKGHQAAPGAAKGGPRA